MFKISGKEKGSKRNYEYKPSMDKNSKRIIIEINN
jgi:hypothetical protein